MGIEDNETERGRQVLEIDIWENEGGAPARESVHLQSGRRVGTEQDCLS